MKDNLKCLNFDLETWEDQVSNRKDWRKTCFIKLKDFEGIRLDHRDQLRQALDQKSHQNPILTNFISRCGFIARIKSRLLSHSRKHK